VNGSLSARVSDLLTSSIRRNFKEAAFGLDQIAQALAVLPERVATQLKADAMSEATGVDTTSTEPAPELPLLKAPAANSVRKLENLFLELNPAPRAPKAIEIITLNDYDPCILQGLAFDEGNTPNAKILDDDIS
jgi:hypothetical protein